MEEKQMKITMMQRTKRERRDGEEENEGGKNRWKLFKKQRNKMKSGLSH